MRPVERRKAVCMTTIGVAGGRRHAQETATEASGNGDPFDFQRLLDEWSGNVPLLRKMLKTFGSESASDLTSLDAAFVAKDAARVAKLAHRIKGSAAVVGARQAHKQAAILEGYGQRCELDDALACLKTLRAELKRCHNFVASLNRSG